MTKSANCTFCIPKLLSPSHRWQYPSIETRASLNFETDRWRRALLIALYFEAMHQGSRHLRIQYVPLVHISLGSGIGSMYFGELCLVLRYFEELVLRCSCGCTGHRMHQASSSAAALTLSALVLLAAGLALWEGCPSPLSCCPFSLVQVYWCKCSSTWKGRIWANEGGSQSPDRGFSWYSYYSLLARTFAAAVGASLHWLTAVCQRKCPNLGVANVRSIMVANVRLENVSQSKQTAIEKMGLSHEVWPHRGSNFF